MSLQTTDADAPAADRVPIPDLPPALYNALCDAAVRHGVPVDDVMEYILRNPAGPPRHRSELVAMRDRDLVRRLEIKRAEDMRAARERRRRRVDCRAGHTVCPTQFVFNGTARCGCDAAKAA